STELQLGLARALEQQGDRAGALVAYLRLVAIEASPAGQVRAIGDFYDYRFGLAHQALGDAARAAGDAATAGREYLAAACGFSRLRATIAGGSSDLIHAGLVSVETVRDLQTRESTLWQWLADSFERSGDRPRARA